MNTLGFITGGVLLLAVFGHDLPVRLASADAPPSVLINELAWAGSSQSTADEWIELHNQASDAMDISGWQLTKKPDPAKPVALMLTVPANTSIPANGYFLIANYSADDIKSALQVVPDLVTTAVDLSNAALQVSLWKGTFSDPENLVDTAWDGTTPTVGGTTPHVSMERNADTNGWHDAQTSVNFDSGADDLGTPGVTNSVIIDPPTLISVAPSTASLEDGMLTITSLTGTNFSLDPIPVVKLVRGNENVVATNVHVADATLIDLADFDIAGLPSGKWDVVLINPDERTATLPEAIDLFLPDPAPDLNPSIVINEVLPSPTTGADNEYVELYNASAQTVDLTGWSLDDIADAGSAPFSLTGKAIAAKGFLTLYKIETRLTLNDSGDTVNLIWPDNTVLSTTTYSNSVKGMAWARFAGGFAFTTTPTANGVNTMTAPEDPSPPTTQPLEPDDATKVVDSIPPKTILINELLPNPDDGQDEFIELYNPGSATVDLSQWKIKDASGKKYVIGGEVAAQSIGGLTVPPHSYIVILQSQSKIFLNNTGGEVLSLLGPNDELVDGANYPDKAPVGISYSREPNTWEWVSKPTPGQVNVLSDDDLPEPAPEVVSGSSLPVTGAGTRRWLGIILTSLALAVILVWYKPQRHAS